MIEDVGVVAENTSIADALERKMPFGVNEREMLLGVEAAVISGAATSTDVQLGDVQLILGLEPSAMLVAMEGLTLSDAFWYRDARLRLVIEQLEGLATAVGQTGGAPGSEGFVSKVMSLPEDECLATIGSHIMQRAARILGAQAETFQYDNASVSSHGIDSMIGVEFQSWLFKEFGVQISVQVISNMNTTFASLARTIAEHLGKL
jgi:acyl carrier protein